MIRKMDNIKKINKVINEGEKSKFNYIRNIFSLLCFMKYNKKKVETSIEKLDNGRYLLIYNINENIYRILLPKITKASNILYVYDELNNDITDIYESYLGPNFNFHGCNYTPKLLGYKSITVVYDNNEIYNFKENDNLNNSLDTLKKWK